MGCHLAATAIQETIPSDEQGVDPFPRKGSKGCVDLAAAASVENMNLKPQRRRGFPHFFNVISVEGSTVHIFLKWRVTQQAAISPPTSVPRSAQAPTWTSPRTTRLGQSRPQRPLPPSMRAFASPLRQGSHICRRPNVRQFTDAQSFLKHEPRKAKNNGNDRDVIALTAEGATIRTATGADTGNRRWGRWATTCSTSIRLAAVSKIGDLRDLLLALLRRRAVIENPALEQAKAGVQTLGILSGRRRGVRGSTGVDPKPDAGHRLQSNTMEKSL
jgi:hypothetical protein